MPHGGLTRALLAKAEPIRAVRGAVRKRKKSYAKDFQALVAILESHELYLTENSVSRTTFDNGKVRFGVEGKLLPSLYRKPSFSRMWLMLHRFTLSPSKHRNLLILFSSDNDCSDNYYARSGWLILSVRFFPFSDGTPVMLPTLPEPATDLAKISH